MSLYKAVDVIREKRRRPKEHSKPGELRWQIYYIDRLIGWMEAGRLIEDDMLAERLMLLAEALQAFAHSLQKKTRSKLPQGILMCETCGTVVDVEECCDEHGDLCGKCKAEAHGEAA